MAAANRKTNFDTVPGVPLAELERSFIEAYLESKGYHSQDLKHLPKKLARQLRIEASIYASNKLAEVEMRSRLIHEIHGDFSRGGA